MTIQYHIYTNDAMGGPVDDSAPAVTTAALTADMPPVGGGADVSYVVRPFDTATGLEDPSNDARVRVRFDGPGDDVTGFPSPPTGLTVRARAGGTAVAVWGYPPGGGAAGFHVYVGPGDTPDYSNPVASVAYDRGSPGRALSAPIAGLADETAYAVAVRAYSALGEEQNTATASVTGETAGPSPVVPVSATATP